MYIFQFMRQKHSFVVLYDAYMSHIILLLLYNLFESGWRLKFTIMAESIRSFDWNYTIFRLKVYDLSIESIRSLNFGTIRSFCWKYTIIGGKYTIICFQLNDRIFSVKIVYFRPGSFILCNDGILFMIVCFTT